eukprot:8261141-Heterocapsa_arctica.AAC.1
MTACLGSMSALMFVWSASFKVAIIPLTSPTACLATPLDCESPTRLTSGTVSASRWRATSLAQARKLGS